MGPFFWVGGTGLPLPAPHSGPAAHVQTAALEDERTTGSDTSHLLLVCSCQRAERTQTVRRGLSPNCWGQRGCGGPGQGREAGGSPVPAAWGRVSLPSPRLQNVSPLTAKQRGIWAHGVGSEPHSGVRRHPGPVEWWWALLWQKRGDELLPAPAGTQGRGARRPQGPFIDMGG